MESINSVQKSTISQTSSSIRKKKKKEECLPKTTALKFATRPSYIQRYFTSFSEPHHMLPSLAVVLSLATALAMTTSWEQSQQEHLP
jgi:hypothetical protein